jgi:hypothetical protein
MKWNHRIVHMNEGYPEEPWCEVQEVYYRDDGTIAGYSKPCLGSEYPGQIIALLERMLDDIKRNPDVVGPFRADDQSDEPNPF